MSGSSGRRPAAEGGGYIGVLGWEAAKGHCVKRTRVERMGAKKIERYGRSRGWMCSYKTDGVLRVGGERGPECVANPV